MLQVQPAFYMCRKINQADEVVEQESFVYIHKITVKKNDLDLKLKLCCTAEITAPLQCVHNERGTAPLCL